MNFPRNAAAGLAAITLLASAQSSLAGTVDPPTVDDVFASELILGLDLLPAWTGQPAAVPVTLTLSTLPSSPTIVRREVNAVTRGGVDAIDVELVAMELVGSSPIAPVRVRVGAGNGFAPGLQASGGEVREKVPAPPNGVMDVPDFDSIFDVFFDVWVDLDLDNVVDAGEVVRNANRAVHMVNQNLSGLPPALDGTDAYFGEGGVDPADPNLGMFGTTVLGGGIELLPVDLVTGNVIGPPHALATSEVHIPAPEIDAGSAAGALALLAGILLLAGERRRGAALGASPAAA